MNKIKKIYKCSECGKEYKTKNGLIVHLLKYHSQSAQKFYKGRFKK